MPRYFFNVQDGKQIPDEDGTEFVDFAAARVAAVRYAGALLSEHEGEACNGGSGR